MHRCRDRQTDSQTDRQLDRQTDRETGRQTDRQTDKQPDREREKERQTDRQTDRQSSTCFGCFSFIQLLGTQGHTLSNKHYKTNNEQQFLHMLKTDRNNYWVLICLWDKIEALQKLSNITKLSKILKLHMFEGQSVSKWSFHVSGDRATKRLQNYQTTRTSSFWKPTEQNMKFHVLGSHCNKHYKAI